jgi:hypothetical protein
MLWPFLCASWLEEYVNYDELLQCHVIFCPFMVTCSKLLNSVENGIHWGFCISVRSEIVPKYSFHNANKTLFHEEWRLLGCPAMWLL